MPLSSVTNNRSVNSAFWKGKNVFLTGHTGFKGGWLSLWLSSMGAKVYGYALAPYTSPNIYDVVGIEAHLVKSHIENICDLTRLQNAMASARPDVVIHMAAQPLVRHSYFNPVDTYATNVMGTVHVLESLRSLDCVRSAIIVTTDKCYENMEWEWGYRENERLGGNDPYSSSKGCAELVTSAYIQSFFPLEKYSAHQVAIATVRAGNVIGGGDWSIDRLIPDIIRAFEKNKSLVIRNPMATRPWQHVLEPLSGYLILAEALYEKGPNFSGGWNFGPNDDGNCTVYQVIEAFTSRFNRTLKWFQESQEQPHEARLLRLDCSKAKTRLGWQPKWNINAALDATFNWYDGNMSGYDMLKLTTSQINDYMMNNSDFKKGFYE